MWSSIPVYRALRLMERTLGISRDRFHVQNLLKYQSCKPNVDHVCQKIMDLGTFFPGQYTGMIALLWAKSHGLPENEDGLSWSLKCGVLPSQWILAERIELLSAMIGLNKPSLIHDEFALELNQNQVIGSELINDTELLSSSTCYDELSNVDSLIQCEDIEHLIDNGFDRVIRKWEDTQIISKLLGEGCRKMALLAEYDDEQQSVAYKFGKYFGLSSILAKNMIDLSQYPENCTLRYQMPFCVFSRRNQDLTSSENLHCSITNQKATDDILTDPHVMEKSRNLLGKYVDKCEKCLPKKDSKGIRTLQTLLQAIKKVGHPFDQKIELKNQSHASTNS